MGTSSTILRPIRKTRN